MSHIALALIGEGEGHVGGKRVAAAQALAAAGLTPVLLAAKDGLALISSNAVTVGHACLVLTDLARTLKTHDEVIALSCEGFRANLSPFVQPAKKCADLSRPAGVNDGTEFGIDPVQYRLRPAPRAVSRTRCRFAAWPRCMAQRTTRSRVPCSTSKSSSTPPPTAH
jgi:hypothetical protein